MRLATCMNLWPVAPGGDEGPGGAGGSHLPIVEGLTAVSLPLRDRLAQADEPFGVGLWLPAATAAALATNPGDRAALIDFLVAERLDAFTFNAFPFGGFHEPGLKARVFEPTWAHPAREAFTLAVASFGLELAREARWEPGRHLSISTHTGGHRARLVGEGGDEHADLAAFRRACAKRLATTAAACAALEPEVEIPVVLGVEPEPRSLAGDTRELGELWDSLDAAEELARQEHAESVADEDAPRAAVGVCLDACHAGGALRGVQSSPGWLDLTHAVELAPLTLLAATDATGVAVERARGDGGALTLALVDGLRRAGAAAHWSTVLDHIRQDGLPDEFHFVGEPTRSVLGGNKVAEVPSRKPHPTVSDPSVGVRLSLVSVDPTQDCAATGPQDTVLPLGTHYGLVVQHLGDTPAWVDLVHRDAHGGETPLWPPAPGLDEPLSPGATWRVPLCLTATAPVGPEELVVRARSRSGTALDLRGVRVVEVPTLVSEDRVDIQVVARPDR